MKFIVFLETASRENQAQPQSSVISSGFMQRLLCTCGESRVVPRALRHHKSHVTVNPLLKRSDHVTLCDLQESQ